MEKDFISLVIVKEFFVFFLAAFDILSDHFVDIRGFSCKEEMKEKANDHAEKQESGK